MELSSDFLGAIGRAVIDDDELPFEVAGGVLLEGCWPSGALQGYLLLGEGLVEQPRDYGQVAALIVRRQEDRVFVLGWHCEGLREGKRVTAVDIALVVERVEVRDVHMSRCLRRRSCPMSLGHHLPLSTTTTTAVMQASKQFTTAPKKNLLLCFDAFGTLFTPSTAIPTAYVRAAARHGIDCGNAEHPHALAAQFKQAFNEEAKQNPNYGKATDLGAEKWWGNVRVCFLAREPELTMEGNTEDIHAIC